MIEVEHISKSFGAIEAVRDVSFVTAPGEIMGFLGPNGAGKTTTMRILTGFFPPTSGTARVGGLDVFEDSLAVRRKIGYLPENVPLYGDLTVSELLRFVAEVKGVPRSGRTAAVGSAVEACRLKDVQNRLIKSLSKGYRQRTGLAQALIGDPEVLILDEPTIGLDPRQINEVRNIIKGFAGEKTVILSTHILPEVSITCQRVVIIKEGRVVAEDTPQNLSSQLTGSGRVRLRVGGPADAVKDKLESLAGVESVTVGPEEGVFEVEAEAGSAPQMAEVVCSMGWDLYELTPHTASLEEVFLNVVTETEEVPEDA